MKDHNSSQSNQSRTALSLYAYCQTSGVGGGADDVKATFNLTPPFAGELTQGDWTLTVADGGKGDEGVLNSWSLDAIGAPAT